MKERAPERRVLYLAALTSVRHDPILRRFYQRLRAGGKKPLVALTAVMRKLIVLLNRLLKNPHFNLTPTDKSSCSLTPLLRSAAPRSAADQPPRLPEASTSGIPKRFS